LIWFFAKGLVRDPSRSLFPILVVSVGTMLTVLLQTWLSGVLGDVVRSNANFSTGHVKIMSRAYAENQSQVPNDLALLDVKKWDDLLVRRYPDFLWVHRIRFGGLLDIPDAARETRAQGPVVGMAIDLTSPGASEIERMGIRRALVRGSIPRRPGEALISEGFSKKLELDPGDTATLITSTVHGSMSLENFTISGTVHFGVAPMDRGAIIIDLADGRRMLDMSDASGEILGYDKTGEYQDEYAVNLSREFNREYSDETDEFSPVMFPLRQQNDLGEYLDLAQHVTSLICGIFVMSMSIVLWSVGLVGGIRRYGEVGLRIALGEEKGRVYRSMLIESALIGLVGSVIGTGLGLLAAWYLQVHGIDLSWMLQKSSMMMSSVYRAKITW